MNNDDNNLATLLRQLRDDTTTLVREEIALARTETVEKITNLARNSVLLVGGVLVGYAALTPLLIGLGFLLGSILTSLGMGGALGTFLGFLIVALVMGGVSAAIIIHSLSSFKKSGLIPQRTINSLKKDKELIKNNLP